MDFDNYISEYQDIDINTIKLDSKMALLNKGDYEHHTEIIDHFYNLLVNNLK